MTDQDLIKQANTALMAIPEMLPQNMTPYLQKMFITGYRVCEESKPAERFIKPSNKQIIYLATLFKEGKVDKQKLVDMVSLCNLVIDRLYENGNILTPSLKEEK